MNPATSATPDLPARPLEEILDSAFAVCRAHPGSEPRLTLWLAGQSFRSCRLISWDRAAGILVCAGGDTFHEDDVHYLRTHSLLGVSLRLGPAQWHLFSFGQIPPPAGPQLSRLELERKVAEVRESLRAVSSASLSLVARPETLGDSSEARAAYGAWLQAIQVSVSEICSNETGRTAFQTAVDQILLRRGPEFARLGGHTLILEAEPARIPNSDQLLTAIEPLL